MTPRDDLDDLLRSALSEEADRLQPAGDGLTRIRERVDRRRARLRWLRPTLALAGVVAAAAVVLGSTAIVRSVDSLDSVPPAGRPSAATTPPTAPSTPSSIPMGPPGLPTPSPAPKVAATSPALPSATPSTGTAAVTRQVFVYYLAPTGNGGDLRLYREKRTVRYPGTLLESAVRAMLRTPPADADYATLWDRQTAVRSVRVSGRTATVDLSSAALRTHGGSQAAALTLQQLVYTVTANQNSVTAVRLTVEGRPVGDFWGAVSARRALVRAPQVDVVGAVWLLAPTQAATVGRTFTLSGTATVFEATVSWAAYRGGSKVAEGFATASVGAPGRGDWSTKVTLPGPGTYEIRAFESSAMDGRPTNVDTKTVVVR